MRISVALLAASFAAAAQEKKPVEPPPLDPNIPAGSRAGPQKAGARQSAQNQGATPAPKRARKASAAPPGPTPDPALTTAFKDAVGRWRCTGAMVLPAETGGGEVKTRSQMTIRREVRGFAYSGEYKIEKTKSFPGFRGRMLWTYDPASKKFYELAADEFGGVVRGESDGMQDGKMVWSEEGVMMGKPARMRTTIVMKGKRELEVQVETVGTLGQASPMGTDRCRKI